MLAKFDLKKSGVASFVKGSMRKPVHDHNTRTKQQFFDAVQNQESDESVVNKAVAQDPGLLSNIFSWTPFLKK